MARAGRAERGSGQSGDRTRGGRGVWLLGLVAVAIALAVVLPRVDGATGAEAGAEAEANVVVMKNGDRIQCAGPPVVAFGRVLYETPDGVKHAVSADLVDLEATRAVVGEETAGPAAQPTPGATPARRAARQDSKARRVAADFEAMRPDGTLVKLSDLRGKVVLVDFWATWCSPCVREMPHIKALHAELAGPDFEIVGVSLDQDGDRFAKFVETRGLNWPHYFDGKGWGNVVAQAYGVRSIPRTVLLDREGNIARTALRGPNISSAVRAVIAEAKPATVGSQGENAAAR